MPSRHAVSLVLAAQLALTGTACGLAFSSGTKPADPPGAFADTEREPPAGARGDLTQVVTGTVPTAGVSLVVNGRPFDAGSLPPPPIPVVVPP